MTDRELMQQALDAATEELPKVDERETVFCSIQGHHLRALCEFVRAALAQPEQEPQYKLICPTCKADRTKVDCQGNRMNCGLKFEAFGVQPDIQPTAWAIYAIPSSDNPIDVTTDAEVLDEIANPVKPLYTAPPQREWQGLTENEKEMLWDEAVEGREHFCSQYGNFADAIEVKLKEKNT